MLSIICNKCGADEYTVRIHTFEMKYLEVLEQGIVCFDCGKVGRIKISMEEKNNECIVTDVYSSDGLEVELDENVVST